MRVRTKNNVVNFSTRTIFTASINKLANIDAEVLATTTVESPPTAEVINASNPLNNPSPFQLGFEPQDKTEGDSGKTPE